MLPSGKTPHAKRIRDLMLRGSRALGLRLCFHDNQHRSGLPPAWRTHSGDPCCEIPGKDGKICVGFDLNLVHRALAGNPDGRIHTCPYGYTEIAVPVFCEGLNAGVLFAGTCWTEKTTPPHPELVCPPNDDWLKDRLVILRSLATEMGRLLMGEASYVPDDRRQQILRIIAGRMDSPLTVGDIADEMHLSPSRTGHLIGEIFGMTSSELIHSVKLQEATRLLSATTHPVAEISGMVGYEDQSYFSRVFKKHYRMSPTRYRRCYPVES